MSQAMTASEILEYVQGAKSALENAPIIDQRKEFVQNTYPLLEMLCQRLAADDERMNDIEETLYTMFVQSESTISADLGKQLQIVFALALRLCDDAENLLPFANVEALGDRNIPETIAGLRHLAIESQKAVHAVTIESDPDDDDDDDLDYEDEEEPEQPPHQTISQEGQ